MKKRIDEYVIMYGHGSRSADGMRLQACGNHGSSHSSNRGSYYGGSRGSINGSSNGGSGNRSSCSSGGSTSRRRFQNHVYHYPIPLKSIL